MQKCVCENDGYEFYKECDELLQEGWKVIPGTVAVSVSAAEDVYRGKESHVAFFTDGKDGE